MKNGRTPTRRISVLVLTLRPTPRLGIGRAGGGVARFLTSEPDQEDITTALDEVLADWAEPVFTACAWVSIVPKWKQAVAKLSPAINPTGATLIWVICPVAVSCGLLAAHRWAGWTH